MFCIGRRAFLIIWKDFDRDLSLEIIKLTLLFNFITLKYFSKLVRFDTHCLSRERLYCEQSKRLDHKVDIRDPAHAGNQLQLQSNDSLEFHLHRLRT